MVADDYKRMMFYSYGITIEDAGRYEGFIKHSLYKVYIPRLDTENHITSLKYCDCDMIILSRFTDVKRYISALKKKDPAYFAHLMCEMLNKEGRSQ